MNKLAMLFLTASLSAASGAVLAADTSSGGASDSNNGQANSSAEAGQVAPDAHQNVAPKGVDGNDVNTTGTDINANNKDKSATGEGMSTDDTHKNTMCKDGRCPDMDKKVETGTGNDVDTKTDGTSQ